MSLELKQIKDLMATMEKAGIAKLRLKQGEFELELEKEACLTEYVCAAPVEGQGGKAAASPVLKTSRGTSSDIPASLHPPHQGSENGEDKASGTFITSPMVGTFYSAAGPDEKPFIRIGEKVAKDTVVCIVEAMKVMNEVKAGVEGTVSEILVESGHPVEFGTKLFRIS